MGLPRRRKTRLKLLAMAALSAVMVTSLATATMAWYSVTVNISVTSSTVTIRTPFQYYFYAYNGNGFNIDGKGTPDTLGDDSFTAGSGYKTTTEANLYAMSDGKPTNYTEVDALKYLGVDQATEDRFINALTTVDGLWPGYKMSFAIKATGLQSDDRPVLKILRSGIRQVDGADDSRQVKRYITNGTTSQGSVCLAQAIQIDAGVGATLQDAATTNLTKINYEGTDNLISINSSWWTSDVNLGGPGEATGGTYWYFYTITFADVPSTWYSYVGTDANSSTPVSTAEQTGNNYYIQSNSGNSNCYQGLTFSIMSMSLENASS